MKICCKCKVEKPTTEFYKRKNRPLGIGSECKDCVKTRARQNWEQNKEVRLETNKQRWILKKEEYSATAKAWREKNKGYITAASKERKVAKMHRTPKWANKEKIKAYYDVCAFFNEVNGYIKYHVDHIIPLQGKQVSGLHVHSNLQVLPALENMSKGNKWK